MIANVLMLTEFPQRISTKKRFRTTVGLPVDMKYDFEAGEN